MHMGEEELQAPHGQMLWEEVAVRLRSMSGYASRWLISGARVLVYSAFIAVTVMTMRSCFHEDSLVCITEGQRAHMMTSCRGRIFYLKSKGAFAQPHTDSETERLTAGQACLWSWGDEAPSLCGFAIRTESFQLPSLGGGVAQGDVNIILPYWALLLLLGCWPVLHILRLWRARKRPPSFPVS